MLSDLINALHTEKKNVTFQRQAIRDQNTFDGRYDLLILVKARTMHHSVIFASGDTYIVVMTRTE